MEKFCYLVDTISCCCGASEAVSARIGSAWKFRELSGLLVQKQGLLRSTLAHNALQLPFPFSPSRQDFGRTALSFLKNVLW